MAAPMQMRILVRSPAALPLSSRSIPMAPPSTIATATPYSSSSLNARISSVQDVNIAPLQKSHPLPHLAHGLRRNRPGPLGTGPQNLPKPLRIGLELAGPLPEGREGCRNVVGQYPLAVEASPTGRPALMRHFFNRFRWREVLVKRVDVTDLGRPRIVAGDAGRIG